jgi:hypothetical protein
MTINDVTETATASPMDVLVEKYLISRKQRGASRRSVINLRSALLSFSRHVGLRPIDKIGGPR